MEKHYLNLFHTSHSKTQKFSPPFENPHSTKHPQETPHNDGP